MAKMIFVSLPVADVAAATSFYEAVGFSRDARFSNDRTAMMTWSDTITFMLLARDFYASLSDKAIADSRTSSTMLLALTCDGRAEVDDLMAKGLAAGGRETQPVEDHGWMYGRALEDPDGHGFQATWMDVDAAIAAMQSATDAG